MKLVLALLCFIAYLGYRAPRPPHQLKINGQYWRVKYLPQVVAMTPFGPFPLAGRTNCEDHEIYISEEEDPEDWPDTLLHEAAHAFTCGADNEVHNDSYNSSAEGEHPGIEKIAQFDVAFMRDNPEAVRWIER